MATKPTDLTRSIQVIGAGYSRTGTVSFTKALERLLDGPVCHSGSASLLREEAFIKDWISILDPAPGKDDAFTKEVLKGLLAGYVGVTDFPGSLFVGEMCAAFPHAIVICTTKDPEKWAVSTEDLRKLVSRWWLEYIFWSLPTARYFGQWKNAMRVRGQKLHGTRDTTLGPDTLIEHNDYVRRVTPPERLFFFDVKDGWGPLCKILNCPVPDEPFPHVNERATLHREFGELVNDAGLRWMQIFAVSGAILGIVWNYWK